MSTSISNKFLVLPETEKVINNPHNNIDFLQLEDTKGRFFQLQMAVQERAQCQKNISNKALSPQEKQTKCIQVALLIASAIGVAALLGVINPFFGIALGVVALGGSLYKIKGLCQQIFLPKEIDPPDRILPKIYHEDIEHLENIQQAINDKISEKNNYLSQLKNTSWEGLKTRAEEQVKTLQRASEEIDRFTTYLPSDAIR